jgi:hypothetical protein
MWRAGQRACFLAPWHVVPRQDIHCQLVGLAVKVFEQGVVEEGVVGGSSQKQGHAGPEFEMVGISEDLLSAATVHVENKLRTGPEPRA